MDTQRAREMNVTTNHCDVVFIGGRSCLVSDSCYFLPAVRTTVSMAIALSAAP